MTKRLVAIVAAVLMLASPVHAGVQKAPENGSRMVKICTREKGEIAEATGQGFVIGVIEATRTYVASHSMPAPFCISKEIELSEIVAVYTNYLRENHALKHFPASMLAVSAFKEAFPCE